MPESILIDGSPVDITDYLRMHGERIERTLDLIVARDVCKVVEVGSHPWAMTAALVEDSRLELLATVSAEEATLWPDDIRVTENMHEIQTVSGVKAKFKNYSFNIERRRIGIREKPDAVLACEIIEHLIRAPHTMLLNINDWLPVGGQLLLTTPNGCQFMNPFRRSPRMPAYRAHCYERHSYVYRLRDLVDLVQLCGFSVREAGFWSPYPAGGLNRLRVLMAAIPGGYFAEKFHRSLCLLARKERSVESLSRVPSIYSSSMAWEDIDQEGQ